MAETEACSCGEESEAFDQESLSGCGEPHSPQRCGSPPAESAHEQSDRGGEQRQQDQVADVPELVQDRCAVAASPLSAVPECLKEIDERIFADGGIHARKIFAQRGDLFHPEIEGQDERIPKQVRDDEPFGGFAEFRLVRFRVQEKEEARNEKERRYGCLGDLQRADETHQSVDREVARAEIAARRSVGVQHDDQQDHRKTHHIDAAGL